MKSLQRSILYVCVLAVYTILFLWPFGIFSDPMNGYSNFPKGDDPQIHVGWMLFFSRNWPNVRWYPYWYGGFPVSLSYHPFAYYVWSAFSWATGLSAELTVFFFTAFSYLLTEVALYGLVYKITKNHDSSLIAAILLVTSIGFLGTLIIGGAYTRVFATAFWMLSLYFLLSYIMTSEKKFFLGTIVSTAITLTSNMFIGIFAVLTMWLTLLCCIKGWKNKIFHSLKISIPSLALSAFFYLPFLLYYFRIFVSFGLEGKHYSTPLPIVNLFVTCFLPLLLLLFSWIITRFVHVEFDRIASDTLKMLKAFIVFFLIYGFIDMPANLRFFASYGTTYFLPLYLSIYNGIVFGGIFAKVNRMPKGVGGNVLKKFSRGFKLPSKYSQRILPMILLVTLFIVPFLYRPMLLKYVVDPAAQSWHYPAYIAEKTLKINPDEKNFRISTDWIHVIRWLNYRFNVPQTSGAHAMALLYPKWYDWYDNTVFISANNWKETNFLLDWYAVKHLLVGNVTSYVGGGIFPRYGPIDKYISKPQYYENASKVNVPEGYWAGPTYQFNYKFATPILSPTDTLNLLVIGKEETYDNLLQSLALSDYDSRFVIPIRGHENLGEYTSEELEKFDAIFLSNLNFQGKGSHLLQNYVAGGGGLIIDSEPLESTDVPLPSPVSRVAKLESHVWNFTQTDSELTKYIDLTLFSQPSKFSVSFEENVCAGAKTVLRSHGYPILVMSEYGKGRAAWTGLDLSKHAVTFENSMESFLLSRLIDAVSRIPERISDINLNSGDSSVGWIALGGNGNEAHLVVNTEEIMEGNASLKASFKFVEKSGYVEYRFNPLQSWDLSHSDFFSFWIYGNSSAYQLNLMILAPDWDDYLKISFSSDSNSWKKVVIPIDYLEEVGSPELSNVTTISITVAISDSASSVREETQQGFFYLDDIRVASINMPQLRGEESYIVDWINPEHVVLKISESAKGVLFKENYFENWEAYLISNNEKLRLTIFRAGPDFMYVRLPEAINYPAEVVFEYRQTWIELFGYITSITTLVVLILYGTATSLKRLFTNVFKKCRLTDK